MLHLIGYRGCGKTTVARLLAKRLSRAMLDADEYLEQQAGKSIKDIFAAEGESGFRDRESAVVKELTQRSDLIVAWGGGVILREANRAALTSSGTIIWLRAKGETLLQRIQQDPTTTARRPNLTAAGGLVEIEQLLAARAGLYAAVASWAIDVDELTPEQVTDGILCWLRDHEANLPAKGDA